MDDGWPFNENKGEGKGKGSGEAEEAVEEDYYIHDRGQRAGASGWRGAAAGVATAAPNAEEELD